MTSTDLLTELLTLEGLLFAGLAAAFAVATTRVGMRPRFGAAGKFAAAVMAGLSIVAAGTLAALITAVVARTPQGFGMWMATVCLGLGILMPPAAGWGLVWILFGKTKSAEA